MFYLASSALSSPFSGLVGLLCFPVLAYGLRTSRLHPDWGAGGSPAVTLRAVRTLRGLVEYGALLAEDLGKHGERLERSLVT